MKNIYKMTTVLLCTAVLFACFCKKEKCPKFTEEQKNPMGYNNGQILFFENRDIENNRTDTLECRVSLVLEEGNVSCNNPDPDKAGSCRFITNTNILSYLNVKKGESYPSDLNIFSPTYCLEYDFHTEQFNYNYSYHFSSQKPIIFKGKKYENYFIDSLLNGSTCNQKYDSIQRVIYWNNSDGVFLAKQYEKGILVNEMLLLN